MSIEAIVGLFDHYAHVVGGVIGGAVSLIFFRHVTWFSSAAILSMATFASWYLGGVVASRLGIPLETGGFLVGLGSLRLCAKIVGGDWSAVEHLIKKGKGPAND